MSRTRLLRLCLIDSLAGSQIIIIHYESFQVVM